MTAILEGIRVVDLGRYIAGPYCASVLADFGAEVIRVEPPGGGVDRQVVPLADDDGGATFLACNRNKASLSLDFTTPEGRPVLERLIASANVVVTNLPPQSLTSMSIDYESLKAIRPDIILANVNAFGSGGPWSHRVGFDGVAQAMSGLVYMTGHPGDPQKAYGPWVDFSSGLYAALGAVAAIHHHARTGEGQEVETAMLHAALVPATPLLTEQAVAKVNREPAGNRSQVGAPADMFATRDGHIIVQIVSQALFKRWARMIGDEKLPSDPRFRDDAARVRNGPALSAIMAQWCASRTTAEALAELDKASLPGGPVLRPQEVLDHEHLAALGVFHPMTYPGTPGPAPLLETPVRLSATPTRMERIAPLCGADTDAVLRDLDFDDAAIAALRQNGTV